MLRTFVILAALVAGLLPPEAEGQQAPGGGDSGRIEVSVHDSLTGGPLAGATVQLISVSDRDFVRTADTDLRGRLTIPGLAPGRYRAGFMHPVLDELGITAPLREVEVVAGRAATLQLAVPSADRVRVAICGARVAADSGAAFVGTVRDPRDRSPVADASVSAQWVEIAFGVNGIQQRTPAITATTGANGWFALCGLPSGTVRIWATSGSDTAPRLDLELVASELRRRDLFVTAPGTSRLVGRVTRADSARALPGARVSVAGSAPAETDADGRWALSEVPLGTQMLEVRAVGYYPLRRPVDVVAEAEPLEVALATFASVLETVRVTASRNAPADLGGFAQRQQRSGLGRYMTAEQIARRNLLETSDLLRTMPGFIGDGSLMMRGNFSDGGGNYGVNCAAEVYVDGSLMRGISAGELDAIVKPENIAGVEVYSAGSPKPPQFESGMSGCGALVIWQKPFRERMRR